MIFSFENMNVSNKVNYLLRKYDLFIQEYAKATPKWDELTFKNALRGSSLGGRRFFQPLSNIAADKMDDAISRSTCLTEAEAVSNACVHYFKEE